MQPLVRQFFLFALCLGCGSAIAAPFNIANGDVAALKTAIATANSNRQINFYRVELLAP